MRQQSFPLDAARRSSRRLRTAVVAIITALAASLLTILPALPQRAEAADLFGHDVSWPQCPTSVGGYNLPMPPTSSQFVIVGLTKGLAFTENPCLASQVKWVQDNNKPAHGYTMATFPTAAQLASYGSSGPYSGGDRAGQLANVGYAEAQFALASLARIGWKPPTIWIDVEPRPASPWPGSTTAQKLENRYVVQGLVRAIRDAGFSYGFYSYTNGWSEIVGSWSVPGVPVWATAGTLDYPNEALDRCTQASFSGGKVYLSQWTDGTRDYNRTCGSYAFGQLPRNLAGATGVRVTASSVDTEISPSPDRAVNGVAEGYPTSPQMEWSSAEQKGGAWIQLTWPSPVTLDRIVLHDRPNADDRILSGTLSFSQGGSVSVGALPNDGAAQSVTFASRTVTSVRLTVNSVSAETWAIGLAEIEAWGTPGGSLPSPTASPTSPPSGGTNQARAAGVAVTASTQDTASGQGATKAVDGSALGYPTDPTREWATTQEKNGAWIQLTWPSPVTLNRIVLNDRPNGDDRILSGTLSFSHGSSISVGALPNDGAAQSFSFPSRVVTSVRLTVNSVSAETWAIGLAEIEAWGTAGGTLPTTPPATGSNQACA
ncbi:MAG: discoidin domain-containing protein, partial [Actinomycetes bacterium]